MARLVSRTEFARLCCVSRAAVTKACSGALGAALVGDRLNLEHAAAQAYRQKHSRTDAAPTGRAKTRKSTPRAPTKPSKRATKAPPKPTAPAPELDEAGFADELGELTLAQIIDRWGTIRAYKDLLEAHEKKERARRNRLENEQTERRLISRDLVKQHVFGAMDSVNKRLLRDSSATIARRVYALSKSDAPIEEAERAVRELISSQLRPVKATAARVLRA